MDANELYYKVNKGQGISVGLKIQANASRLALSLREVSDNLNTLNWADRAVISIRRPFIQNKILVHPCVIDGNSTLIYQNKLHKKSPSLYKYLVEFAGRNGFQLREDQRSGKRGIRKDQNGRLMPVMVLGAGMITQASFAADVTRDTTDPHFLDNDFSSDKMGSRTINSFSDESLTALMTELLDWINDNSTFSYRIAEMPAVKRVSPVKMANMAFGGNMRKALDLKRFKIYGLYNFEENAIYIVNWLDLESEKGKAILLHELVHFLQYQSGHENNVQCRNELEALAYLLETHYLTSHGDSAHGIDVNQINRISQCGVSEKI